MPHYLSLLRGINVSGKNGIKMDALRKCYESMGFAEVNTYVQSGNVLFSTIKTDPALLAASLSLQIKKVFGFDVPVLVVSGEKLSQIIKNNPFTHNSDKAPSFLHVTLLASTPAVKDIKSIDEKKGAGEECAITDSAVYLYCPNGYGRTKLNNNFLESKLKTHATTRNWKTLCELQKMLDQ